jgi:hypothetical protein
MMMMISIQRNSSSSQTKKKNSLPFDSYRVHLMSNIVFSLTGDDEPSLLLHIYILHTKQWDLFNPFNYIYIFKKNTIWELLLLFFFSSVFLLTCPKFVSFSYLCLCILSSFDSTLSFFTHLLQYPVFVCKWI